MNAGKWFKGITWSGIVVAIVLMSFGISSATLLGGDKINPENRIDLAERGDGGAWKTDDLVVTYDYDRTKGRMDISGKVRFYTAGQMLETFWLTLYVLNDKNEIIGSESVATAPYSKGMEAVIPFEDSLELPEGASGFTFGYHGEVAGTGGQQPRKIWNTPGE